MRLLFCSPCRLDRTLGAAQTLMDLSEELERLGWRCDLVGPDRLKATGHDFPARLRDFLMTNAQAYDVIDFDYKDLSFERSDLPRSCLLVARCQLLLHHYLDVDLPPLPTPRARLRHLLLSRRDRRRLIQRIRRADATLHAADRVIVLNDCDAEVLARHGHTRSKIKVVPNGMTEERLYALASAAEAPSGDPIVAFIGMFGPRKGAADFPDLVRRVTEAVPDARFRLLGTRGRLKTEADVLALFARSLRRHVEVLPTFDPSSLPGLLAPCAVGVFPSYVEGFGLAVLEMMAAGLPVIAYDAPGPAMLLPPEALVPRGDTQAMSRHVIKHLREPGDRSATRQAALKRAQTYSFKRVARQLADVYQEAVERHRAVSQAE